LIDGRKIAGAMNIKVEPNDLLGTSTPSLMTYSSSKTLQHMAKHDVPMTIVGPSSASPVSPKLRSPHVTGVSTGATTQVSNQGKLIKEELP